MNPLAQGGRETIWAFGGESIIAEKQQPHNKKSSSGSLKPSSMTQLEYSQ
jgi:hypothetical protein